CRVQRLLEDHLAIEKLRHKYRHELSENMTERNKIKKAKRMDQTSPFQIWFDFLLKRDEVCEKIAMCDHNTFWFSGCARGEHNFDGIVLINFRYGVRCWRMACNDRLSFFQP